MDWGFLKRVLLKIGFNRKWVDWIMLCVTKVEYLIIVNDSLVGPETPGRGLRQGDTLSPYIFIIYTEGLSVLINHATLNGSFHGMKICRTAPSITHLVFADDCFLFCHTTEPECQTLRNIIASFKSASGLGINFSKSSIFFSANVSPDDNLLISDILGISQPLNTGRYLRLPPLVGRNKRAIFSYLYFFFKERGRGNDQAHRGTLIRLSMPLPPNST